MISTEHTVLVGEEVRQARNALNYYSNNLKQMAKARLKIEEIQTWLKKRNVDIPDYFLKNFLKQFQEPKKVVFPQENARIQSMKIDKVKEKNEIKPKLTRSEKKKLADGKYWGKQADEIFPQIKAIFRKNGNKPTKINEFVEKLNKPRQTLHHVFNSLCQRGWLNKGKEGKYNIYTLTEKGCSIEIKTGVNPRINIDKLEKVKEQSEVQQSIVPEITFENIFPGESDLKVLLKSKKIDLLKLFAANIATPKIISWLKMWDLQVTYDELLKFKEEHKQEIETLKQDYKRGFAKLKSSKRVYRPTINELTEIFNIQGTYVSINTTSKETFFKICNILNGHAIDFNMFVDSTEDTFEILIADEEAS